VVNLLAIRRFGVIDSFPLAFHITFGTYGTRLHGDERGTVDRSMNQYGDPILGKDEDWEQMERERLKFEPRIFSVEQMIEVERLIPDVCIRGGWQLHTCAAGPDHVHNVLTAQADGEAVRKWLKRWLGQELAKSYSLRDGQTFWAECGSVKWIWTEEYLLRAVKYVSDQRATEGFLRR
jgi:REP element-mobilizing transposase RayT